jgi:uncharacterized protein (TIGR00159 family)
VTDTLLSVRLAELVDLAVAWIMVWSGIAWLRTTRARLALAGLGILAAVYALAHQLGLVLTTWILQGFAAVAVLIAVVVFQQDLRRLFERIAALGLRLRPPVTSPEVVDALVSAIVHLTQQHRGALIVLQGREPVDDHVEGGLPLEARISEPLVLSLFDPHSPGHDGALVCVGARAARFAVHLPLSTDRAQLGSLGTRHAAALGLAEQTDALCIAVSEERATVSIAENGRFRMLDSPQAIAEEIRGFLERLGSVEGGRPGPVQRALERWREGLLALPIAGLLWLLAIPGATVVELEREAPVSVDGVPEAYTLERVEPGRVRVTLAGPRRDLFFLGPEDLEVHVDAILVELGRRSFRVTPADVEHPEGIEIRAIQPDRVRVELAKRGASPKDGAGVEAR